MKKATTETEDRGCNFQPNKENSKRSQMDKATYPTNIMEDHLSCPNPQVYEYLKRCYPQCMVFFTPEFVCCHHSDPYYRYPDCYWNMYCHLWRHPPVFTKIFDPQFDTGFSHQYKSSPHTLSDQSRVNVPSPPRASLFPRYQVMTTPLLITATLWHRIMIMML